MDPVVLASARKHGVHDEDLFHAYHHPISVLRLDDLLMLIGPGRAGQLLEVGVSHAEGIDFVVHAIPAWAQFLR